VITSNADEPFTDPVGMEAGFSLPWDTSNGTANPYIWILDKGVFILY